MTTIATTIAIMGTIVLEIPIVTGTAVTTGMIGATGRDRGGDRDRDWRRDRDRDWRRDRDTDWDRDRDRG